MTTSKTAASSPKKGGGAAARSEKNATRKVELFGIPVELVSKVPASFSLRLAKVQSGRGNHGDVLGLLYAVGITEEQFDAYVEKVESGEIKPQGDDALFDFAEKVLGEFGSSVGESSASGGS